MVSTLISIAAAEGTQPEPPSTFAMLVWLAMFAIIVWGLLSGWLADLSHSMWAGTVFLPGVMSDLPTLKRICRWGGILLLLIASGMCIVAFFEHLHHARPTI